VDNVGAGIFAKPLLVEISHTVERFALAGAARGPLVLIAMFQRLAYFQREAEVYAHLAAQGVVTVVGVVDDGPAALPTGVHRVLLANDLVEEWSVTALGPSGGATLVAADREALEPGAPTLERGRTFRAGWSFRRDEARQQVLRLRARLDLDASARGEVDAVLQAVDAADEPAHQEAWDAALHFLTRRLDAVERARAEAGAALAAVLDSTERDQHTGFHSHAFLDRWLAGSPDGTLPIGLVLLRLDGLSSLRADFGRRAELAVLKRLAQGLRQAVGGADRVIALGPEDFLVLLPSAGPADVLEACNAVSRIAGGLDEAYPFITLPAKVAGTVTRERPLPIARLRTHAGSGQDATLVPA
jgi:GGDEF domain-containing protein